MTGPRDTDLEAIKHSATTCVADSRELLRSIITTLHARPELGGQEWASSQLLIETAADAGFAVERPVGGLETAFKCTHSAGGISRPSIAFIAEYDALPGLGHGCGHNASAAASLGAAISVAMCQRLHDLSGTVLLIGTPGEENLSAKIQMIDRGVFAGVHAALMVHAYDRWAPDAASLALVTREFTFTGHAAHAAATPESGINALNATMLTFHGIDCLRQHITEGCRIHGIVTDGGEAPNIVPEVSSSRFFVRSPSRRDLRQLARRVEACAEGAARMTGCTVDIASFAPAQDELVANAPLLDLFREALCRQIPRDEIQQTPVLLGSSDVGNLSHTVPTIHPMGAFAPLGVPLHTHEFAAAMRSDAALDAVCVAATALAHTALDLLVKCDLLDRVETAHASLGAPGCPQ